MAAKIAYIILSHYVIEHDRPKRFFASKIQCRE